MAKKDDETLMPEPQPEVSTLDMLRMMAAMQERFTTAIESISARRDEGPAPNQDKMAEALQMLAEATKVGSELQARETRRAHRPSNEVVPMISVFNRRGETLDGYKKPALKCVMMIPWLAEWESQTREEVELLNLLEPGIYQMELNDGESVAATVKIDFKVDGKPSRLLMTHETAFNNDNFKKMLPMRTILRNLLSQHREEVASAARFVMTDSEEKALIEAGKLLVSV